MKSFKNLCSKWKTKTNSRGEEIALITLTVLIFIIVVVAAYWFSWLITCWLVKLICGCFGWAYTKSIGTGVWLVTLLLRSVFQINFSNKEYY